MGPQEKIIMDGQKERQGDFVFTATETGEYKFCFNNQMSTFAEKFVDFEIAVRFAMPDCVWPSASLDTIADLRFPMFRSRTKNGPQYPRNRAHRQNKPLRWKNPSSKFQANSRQSQEIRSTSALERTGISAQSEVRREESSTSALLRA
jgi:hypothetical protein